MEEKSGGGMQNVEKRSRNERWRRYLEKGREGRRREVKEAK